MTDLTRAIAYATKAHDGQTDKNGEPYILHPLRVMMSMNTEVERIVAALHDVIEDTDATMEQLEKEFGREVALAVVSVSRYEGEAWQDFIHRAGLNPIGRPVKIMDVKDNMSPIRIFKLPHETRERLERKYIWAINELNDMTRETLKQHVLDILDEDLRKM